jgi:hypothetical protein
MNRVVKIDKGIPLPKKGNTSGLPFADLNVGDSFFIEGKRPSEVSNLRTYFQKKLKVKFASRMVDGGTRIWRIK